MNDTQAIEITPGEHPTRELFGMTFNIDTIASTLVAGAIVVVLGFLGQAQADRDQRGSRPDQDPAGLGVRHHRGDQPGRVQPGQGQPVRGPARRVARSCSS